MGSKSAIGIGNGICFKQVRDKGGGSYIDPLVRDSIVGIWKSNQNTNESPTRNIIKNTIKDKGGDLELLNFGYKLNSGYGKYEEDFTTWKKQENVIVTHNKVSITPEYNQGWLVYIPSNTKSINSMKVNIIGVPNGGILRYYYTKDRTDTNSSSIKIVEDGIYTLPGSVITDTGITVGFDRNEIGLDWSKFTITQIPSFEGALVTDGKDDMIVSQKTVQEMLGGSKEITVVSMIHQINVHNSTANTSYTNYIKRNIGFVRNTVTNADKTGIYGYTWNNSTKSTINNILGDKNDYRIETDNNVSLEEKFSVEGYINNGSPDELSEVAVYWTFIANKVLTTDEINQIIGYYKLDKYVTPQVIYDVKRQGLTNDTPDSDWYLKDFSGNGYDMQLYNYAKKGNSGIGKYEVDFTLFDYNSSTSVFTATYKSCSISKILKDGNRNIFYNWGQTLAAINSTKIQVTGLEEIGAILEFMYLDESGNNTTKQYSTDGIYDLPASTAYQGDSNNSNFGFSIRGYIGDCDITITQIPDYEGALVSDGKDDFGKAKGLPILKDYTVAADYARLAKNISSVGDSPILSKSIAAGNGAFIMNNINDSGTTTCYSFGTSNNITLEDIQRKIYYQSKYSNQGKGINAGSIGDGTSMWLDTIRDNDTRFIESAFYSMLLFPYSLSEFLLERQLKRYKLGTLYPGMIEWRPKVNINVPVVTPPTFSMNNGSDIITNGQYIPEGTEITIRIFTTTDSSVGGLNEATAKINGVDIELSPSGNKTYYGGKFIVSSKQKIDITIDEYIRYEDIVHPYPAIVNLKQDGKTITWGDKLKVGSEVTFVNHINLLPEIYDASGRVLYNGTDINDWNSPIVVAKSMVFTNFHGWKLNTTEPYAIYSPQKLNIPNSSLKILGYVPDLTGKGNHGKLNNFAYTEDSGVAADGSIKFDGTDDHITIPTLAYGGKCVMMKVNSQKYDTYLYDQRNQWSQYLAIVSAGKTVAYNYSNQGGKTYIDGILNENIIDKDLIGITHNITVVNSGNAKSYSPIIGTSFAKGNFGNMSLYEFMLFPEIPSEDEIKKLNDVMGIEGGYVESPNYYWDAYGKKNTDTDRNLIADQVSKDVANALEVKNVGYNSESGYTDDNGLLLDGIEDYAVNTAIPAVTDFTVIAKREFPESTLANNQTFLTKGDAINGNNDVNSLLMECYFGGQNYIISFSSQQIIPLEESKISWITPTSYNGNALTKGSGVDSVGLTIGGYKNLYRKTVLYKLMFYTKTIDQLSINMLKNLFERDELIDVTNPIFKKEEL